jgi:hypothetical protein
MFHLFQVSFPLVISHTDVMEYEETERTFQYILSVLRI